MADKSSQKSLKHRTKSSSISNTSDDSGSCLIGNEPLLRNSLVRVRRGRRPPKKQEDHKKEEKKTILSWIIKRNIVQESAGVCYMRTPDDQKPLKFGKLTRAGILCTCCIQVLTAENFQEHVVGKVDKPYEHIFVVDMNKSLLYCMVKAWNHPRELARQKFNKIEGVGQYNDTYDDACIICADGGQLMCCDKCYSTYHHRCMGMEDVPENSWFCPYCVCKLCDHPGHNLGYLFTCSQCEKKYHWECYRDREHIQIDINSTPSAPFCEQGCKEIYEKLEKMVGINNKLEDGYTWTLLRRMDEDDSAGGSQDSYIRTECHSKLAIAWSLMKDCFEPITDRHTTIDVIQSIVYNCGSNYTRINFRGFYTAALEKDGEIVSAASLRIHGTKLAEMPFIATNAIHRRKGLCRKLMTAIESVLWFLNVGYLIIPSVHQKEQNWMEGYNFSHLNAEMKKQIMCFNTVMFHDSVRLQKVVPPPSSNQVAREGEKKRPRKLEIDLNKELMDNTE